MRGAAVPSSTHAGTVLQGMRGRPCASRQEVPSSRVTLTCGASLVSLVFIFCSQPGPHCIAWAGLGLVPLTPECRAGSPTPPGLAWRNTVTLGLSVASTQLLSGAELVHGKKPGCVASNWSTSTMRCAS